MENFDNNYRFFPQLWGWNDSWIVPHKSIHFPQIQIHKEGPSEILLNQHEGKNYHKKMAQCFSKLSSETHSYELQVFACLPLCCATPNRFLYWPCYCSIWKSQSSALSNMTDIVICSLFFHSLPWGRNRVCCFVLVCHFHISIITQYSSFY